jgi:hypothetical protein
LYGDVLRAIELFPAANTLAGWGETPNPAEYAKLMQTVRAALQSDGLTVTLVTSVSPALARGDLDDRAFLENLYANGAAGWMPVVGLQFPALSGEPKGDPSAGAGIVLRHFEALREVMIRNQHASGRMWITSFSWPAQAAYATPEGQAQWINRAYKLLRAQIYVETAFFRQLNPPSSGNDPATGFITSLILPDGRLHPACEPLSQLTSLGGTEQKTHFQSPVTKKTSQKSTLKP